MKKLLSILVLTLLSNIVVAQVSKTINVPTAGTLASLLTKEEKSTITDLTVTGNIDARDFRCMRDELLVLSSIDLSAILIQEYNGSFGTLSGYNKYSKNELSKRAFYQKRNFFSITLPSTLISIGDESFYNCGLTCNIKFPETLLNIGANAFAWSSIFGNIVIPNSVYTIGNRAFFNCVNVKGSLTIGNSVTSVSNEAFANCTELSGCLTLGSAILTIGDNAFQNCSKIKTIVSLNPNPPVLNTIDFANPTVYIPLGTNGYYNYNQYTYANKWNTFNIVALTNNVTITNSVAGKLYESIANAGYNSTLLADLKIIGVIDARDFKYLAYDMPNLCKLDLSEVSIDAYTGYGGVISPYARVAYSADAIPDYTFYDINNNSYGGPKLSLTSVKLPSTLKSIGNSAFYGCNLKGTLVIPNTVKSIGSGAFSSCKSLTGDLLIPKSVTFIGSSAFYDCIGLNGNLVLSDSIKTINEGTFSNCSGLIGKLSLPNVVSIGDNAFSNCSSFNDSLILSDSLKKIGVYAFQNCKSITNKIVLPDLIQSIGDGAFMQCESLKGSLSIPNYLSSIGLGAFSLCSGITDFIVADTNNYYSSDKNGVLFNKNKTVLIQYPNNKNENYVIPEGVQVISNWAFFNCKKLTSVDLPVNLKTISYGAFAGCSGLKKLKYPDSLLTISAFAFSECVNICDTLILPNGLKNIGASAFYNCGKINYVSLPSTIEDIPSMCFADCANLTKVILPLSLKTIGEAAFTRCYGLKSIYCSTSIPPVITVTSFSMVTPKYIFVPQLNLDNYKNANYWKDFPITAEKRVTILNNTAGGLASAILLGGNGPLSSITHLTVSGGLNSIDITQIKNNMTILSEIDISQSTLSNNILPDNSFQNKTSLTTIKLPNNLLQIGNSAFSGCTSLVEIFPLPSTLVSIGDLAYNGCIGVKSNFTFPNTVTNIGKSAFYGCSGLSGDLNLPSGLMTVNEKVFYGCSGVFGNVTFPNSISSIGNYAFYNCINLSGELKLPSNISKIGSFAFYNCLGLNGSLNIPILVTEIGESAFFNCKGFTGDLFIPNSVVSLGASAFNDCINFTGKLVISNKLTTLPNSTFSGCTGIKDSLFIPTSVTSIGSSVFKGCYHVSYLNINSNMTNIGDYAFSECSNINKIDILSYVPPLIYLNTFSDVNKELCLLNVPWGTALNYQTTNYWSDFIFVGEKNFDTPTGVYLLTNREMKVYPAKSGVVVESVSSGDLVEMFTITGLKVNSVRSSGEKIFFPAKSGNTYLVKTASKTMKVVL